MKFLRIVLLLLTGLALLGIVAFFTVAPGFIEGQMNRVSGDRGGAPDEDTRTLHESLIIGDLHADTALWQRSLNVRSDRGHVDIPRLIEGNFALQMFTTVTKSPRGQNYEANAVDAADNISLLGLAQRWPQDTHDSLFARAMYQGQRVIDAAAANPELTMVTSQEDLAALMGRRGAGEKIIGAMLGTEGSHALDGELGNIDRLYHQGFRMMSLQHFFDNRLGGSLHGLTKQGLTPFGEQAVDRMVDLGIMIDVSHSAEAVVLDVLARTDQPLIVSHTGFQGHCDSPRNISDSTMARIADGGGLIGVGFWEGATCGVDLASVVGALRYGIDQFGLEHIALGSDWDGSVTTPIDASEISYLTHALRRAAFSEAEIRAVMGENMLRFLQANLPTSD